MRLSAQQQETSMTENKTEKIFFRMDPIVTAHMKSRATALGLTVSEFLRLAVLSALGICVPCDPKGMKDAVKSEGDDD
jgi:hypothetical protein